MTTSSENHQIILNRTLSSKIESDVNCNEIENINGGRIFYSELQQLVGRDNIAESASLGHYLINKLETDSADCIILLDVESDRRWLGKELKEKVLNIAAALIDKHNLQPGQAVCISHDHSDISCILALGIICAGGIVACAYPKDPYAELLYLARKVEPKILFCNVKNFHWAQKLESDLKYPVATVAMGGDSSTQSSGAHIDDYLNYDHKLAKCSASIPVACKDMRRSVALVTMSSGTTGKPKVVPVTHMNCLGDLNTFVSNAKGVYFACSASLDYVSGRIILLGAIETGYTAVILNGFEPETFLEAVQKYSINLIYMGAASFYNLITYKHLDNYDISSVKIIFPMGAKIIYLEELGKFLRKHAHILQVRQGYGSSELSGVAMNSMSPEEYLKDCENSGTLLPGIKAKIVDQATGKILGINEKGMLHVGGYNVFPGYYDLELARATNSRTAEGELDPFVGGAQIFDDDGFYITGDIAFFNERNQLYIVGRYKELMSCRGAKKVLPQELEEIIEEHPAVSKVCVIGAPNKRQLTLHCPRAFIELKPNYYTDEKIELAAIRFEESTESGNDSDNKLEHRGEHKLCKLPVERRRQIVEDLMAYVNSRIGWEKQLTGGVIILDYIPTSKSTGKIDKGYLRSLTVDQVEIYGDRSEQ